jgi:hypothetical protein
MTDKELQTIIEKVRALRDLTTTTGFKTSRSIGELLGHLNAEELATVSLALQRGDRE